MVTINCDMGEAFGIYNLCDDASVMPFVTHINVACGFHASDPIVMWNTVKLARTFEIGIGAHPGLPDKEGFGRREMKMTRDEIASAVMYQVGALSSFLQAEGLAMTHIKPHGALMGMAQKQESTANAIADAAQCFELPVIAVANSVLADVLNHRKIPFVCEFYVDLEYDDNGVQVISRHPKTISPQDAAAKAVRALDVGVTRSKNGNDVDVVADSICVHGDTVGAAKVAEAVYTALSSRLKRNLI
ncbi:MAG: 5-oxoprolinase subunit PxpA [Rhizobiales bacterium]|nr:5-oxoprolinase subunit PxpA [Hyphomicrobiales bacterium]